MMNHRPLLLLLLLGSAAVGTAQCSDATTCLECLTREGCAAWSKGTCLASCSEGPTDTSCWSTEYGGDTPDSLCTMADDDQSDRKLCSSRGDCDSCLGATTSNGGNNCEWFEDTTNGSSQGGYCSNGCGMIGCGAKTCPVQDDAAECYKDDDCLPAMRSQVPPEKMPTGVGMCGCYAASALFPFDECEGESKDNCPIAMCLVDSCDGKGAACDAAAGTCVLTETTAECYKDDDCLPTMRSQVPSENKPTGVGLCGCYAASALFPFDECEGESKDNCPIAMCLVYSCDKKGAACDATGTCVLTETTECSAAADCVPTMRSRTPTSKEPANGVGLCGCYAASSVVFFDECEGDASCPTARCAADACEGKEAMCDGAGTCSLQNSGAGLANPASTHCEENSGTLDIRGGDAGDAGICVFVDGSECEEWAFMNGECGPGDSLLAGVVGGGGTVECSADSDCFPKIRAREPAGQTEPAADGVGLCECYAASSVVPFDECEGEASCKTAKCAADACDGRVTTCDADAGTCSLAAAGSGVPATNAASAHCEANGGASENRTDEAGKYYSVCVLQDGSECEEGAFMQGECGRCSAATSCLDCLERENCDAWSADGDGECLPSCSSAKQDASCWSAELMNGSTSQSICTQVDKGKVDNDLCNSQQDCESCKGATTSDGGKNCQWFQDGSCSNGCGMNGCGLDTCPVKDDDGVDTASTDKYASGASIATNSLLLTSALIGFIGIGLAH